MLFSYGWRYEEIILFPMVHAYIVILSALIEFGSGNSGVHRNEAHTRAEEQVTHTRTYAHTHTHTRER